MNKALFLDRDGVINKDGKYIYKKEDFIFNDEIFELCRQAIKKGYKIIVVTNQSGIARGYYTEDDFLALTDWMTEKFLSEQIEISKVYYCPYHPINGIGKYKKESSDRKPNTGMILKAKEEFEIDLSKSIIIGDKNSDMQAGYSSGIAKMLLYPNEYDYKTEDYITVINSLNDAEKYL